LSSLELGLPTLDELGRDLVQTVPWQRRRTLARPVVLVFVYAAACALEWYWLTPLIVFFIFVAIVTAAHDLVHGALGMRGASTDAWLFVTGAILLASGHSYRLTHLQHHRVFPGPDDPEGDPARMTLWQAIGYGPVFLPRLWWWSFKRASKRDRRWLVAEAVWAGAVVVAGVVLWPLTPGVVLYALLVWGGAWVFPLLTVHLPHKDYGDTVLTQTRTLRGRLIPAIFLELTYHLEHHLYPQVPSHRLAELSRRLEPTLTGAGVVPWYVP
jgi:beta-carotene hydroxylase